MSFRQKLRVGLFHNCEISSPSNWGLGLIIVKVSHPIQLHTLDRLDLQTPTTWSSSFDQKTLAHMQPLENCSKLLTFFCV